MGVPPPGLPQCALQWQFQAISMIGGKTDEGGHWRGLNTATTQKKKEENPA